MVRGLEFRSSAALAEKRIMEEEQKQKGEWWSWVLLRPTVFLRALEEGL